MPGCALAAARRSAEAVSKRVFWAVVWVESRPAPSEAAGSMTAGSFVGLMSFLAGCWRSSGNDRGREGELAPSAEEPPVLAEPESEDEPQAARSAPRPRAPPAASTPRRGIPDIGVKRE